MKLLTLVICLCVVQTVYANENEIESMLAKREAAWEKQDIDGLTFSFADDIDYIDSTGKKVSGKKACVDRYKALFASDQYKGTKSTQRISKIRLLQPEIAVVDAEWSLSGLKTSEGKPIPDRTGTTLLVVVKESTAWKIVTMHVAANPQEQAK